MSARVASRPKSPKTLARKISRLALEKKAEDIVILDLTGLSAACDCFVICSGASEPQVGAIAEQIVGKLKEQGIAPWHVEGRAVRRWILIDYVDVVVHVFHHETREYYTLERLWADAKVTKVREPARTRRREA